MHESLHEEKQNCLLPNRLNERSKRGLLSAFLAEVEAKVDEALG